MTAIDPPPWDVPAEPSRELLGTSHHFTVGPGTGIVVREIASDTGEIAYCITFGERLAFDLWLGLGWASYAEQAAIADRLIAAFTQARDGARARLAATPRPGIEPAIENDGSVASEPHPSGASSIPDQAAATAGLRSHEAAAVSVPRPGRVDPSPVLAHPGS